MTCPDEEGIETCAGVAESFVHCRRPMTCPDEEGIETIHFLINMANSFLKGPMTCPDEEGIETYFPGLSALPGRKTPDDMPR